MNKTKDIKQISMIAATPEKAGVGGSIPSLATIFQTLRKRERACRVSLWAMPWFGDNGLLGS